MILQQKRSERALADLAASAAVELAAAHEHYRIIMNDIGMKMNDMQAQIDAEQNMKRDWTQVQRKNIQSARSHSEKLASLQVWSTQHPPCAQANTVFLILSPVPLQHTCDIAVQKAGKLDSLYTFPTPNSQPNFSIEFRLRYTEQLRLNQIQSDRIATLESDNASLTNKVFIDNAATRGNSRT